MNDIRYVSLPDTFLVANRGDGPGATGSRQLLLGARIHVDASANVGGFVPARTPPDENGNERTGFVDASRISARQQLKIFYLDVGQGDATLIEAEGAIVLIDGGPSRSLHDELVRRLDRLRAAEVAVGRPAPGTLRIDALVVTHFDLDHYFGLIRVLEDPQFVIRRIFHNGLPRYHASAGRDLDLGSVTLEQDGTSTITGDLRGFSTVDQLLASGELQTAAGNDNRFGEFLRAVNVARAGGRLGGFQRLVRRDPSAPPAVLPNTGPDMTFEVLGPVTTTQTGAVRLRAFPDPHDVTATNPNPAPSDSHTVNGNSIVLRLNYGTQRFLFGGDLNQPAQLYLASRAPDPNAFRQEYRSDVNKACHHGSSDFDLGFLRAVNPHATVFSSGDNGSHDHPLPDAMGAAARHSRGQVPLVFSTELIRGTRTSGVVAMLGHVNGRSNGNVVVMAQRKERPSTRKTWHAFEIPSPGPFG